MLACDSVFSFCTSNFAIDSDIKETSGVAEGTQRLRLQSLCIKPLTPSLEPVAVLLFIRVAQFVGKYEAVDVIGLLISTLKVVSSCVAWCIF
ncbi:hypothetical protein VNO78_22323 [Psophocarpus tetragonolobus]|uniref:Uncharacterized protein n=1 Tax=Psophocarpus tetragonolobus TaxID=3891 RepID=A0AAN9XIW3_PSOTE